MTTSTQLPPPEDEPTLPGLELPSRQPGSLWPYGAISVAAEYCNRSGNITTPPGEWQHGWHPSYHNVHPELMLGWDGTSLDRRAHDRFWVARADQAQYLRQCGYKYVEAIGLPMVYVQRPSIQRKPGSLLVIPVHSVPLTAHEWDFDEYAEVIRGIKNQFSEVVACVHPVCFDRGYWVDAFRQIGVPVIAGAQVGDSKSLLRMAKLFSRFEFVTSNGFGSHVAYSTFFGAKFSIYGPLATYSSKDLENDMMYKRHPGLLPVVLEFLSEQSLLKRHGEFFCAPWAAEVRREWAARELGADCRRTPSELRGLFGWGMRERAARFVAIWRQRLRPRSRLLHALRRRRRPQ